jgi:hypothetical protein
MDYLQERVSESSRASGALIHSFFEGFRSEAKSGRYITQRSIVQIEQYHKRPTHRTYCSPNGNGRGRRRAVTQSSPFFRSFPRTLFSKSTHASTAMFRQDRTRGVSCDRFADHGNSKMHKAPSPEKAGQRSYQSPNEQREDLPQAVRRGTPVAPASEIADSARRDSELGSVLPCLPPTPEELLVDFVELST